MKKAIALGLFVISILFGMASVVLGTIIVEETFVWMGMLVIGLGIINLIVKITFPQQPVSTNLIIERSSNLRKVNRKNLKKKSKIGKKSKKR